MILYESYFDKETNKPYQFVRKIDEGGYTKIKKDFLIKMLTKYLVKDYKNKRKNFSGFRKRPRHTLNFLLFKKSPKH
jgi:hypothetical protein